MNIRGINHVGLTVPDLEEATQFMKKAFDAKIAYDGLTSADEPRQGAEIERFLGLPQGAKIVKQRMLVIGNGANIEMFEIEHGSPRSPIGLQDYGWNHISLFVEDIEAALKQAVAAGAEPFSAVHDNSRYEDTEGNGSVYIYTPWRSMVELQTIPNGYYYPDDSEEKVFIP